MMPEVKAGSLFVPFPCFAKQLACPSSTGVPCIGRVLLLPLLLVTQIKVQVAML